MWSSDKTALVNEAQALKGRSTPLAVTDLHVVKHVPVVAPFPAEMLTLYLGMGCFWGAERALWQVDGVYTTAVGYAGGYTENPTYQEVCTGKTGHTEVVMVVYDPAKIRLSQLLQLFWERHDPTQGMRQGNDIGTQYRSAIYTTTAEQAAEVERSKAAYGSALAKANKPAITTEIRAAPRFYYAEDYHQQYLAKNPDGYCGLKGTGIACVM